MTFGLYIVLVVTHIVWKIVKKLPILLYCARFTYKSLKLHKKAPNYITVIPHDTRLITKRTRCRPSPTTSPSCRRTSTSVRITSLSLRTVGLLPPPPPPHSFYPYSTTATTVGLLPPIASTLIVLLLLLLLLLIQ